MKNIHLILAVVLIAAGCAKPIPYRHVNFQDGVYDGEILSIATHELETSEEKDNFAPKGSFMRNRNTRCLENHKVVIFPSRKMFSNRQYFVIVNQNTGVVTKSGEVSTKADSWVEAVRGVDGCV